MKVKKINMFCVVCNKEIKNKKNTELVGIHKHCYLQNKKSIDSLIKDFEIYE